MIAAVDAYYGVYEGSPHSEAVRPRVTTPRHSVATLPLWGVNPGQRHAQGPGAHLSSREALHELRSTTAKLRLTGLTVGRMTQPLPLVAIFVRHWSKQPSNTKFLFGPAVWIRGLIRPPSNHGIACIDFAARELAIAAALSGDARMAEDYVSDPCLGFMQKS